MIDRYSNLNYTSFEVIRDSKFGGIYDKLLIFDKFRDGQNLYFDLDILIKGDCNKFIKKELTVCHAWWRSDGKFYKLNPINSSIISWNGDQSHIFHQFNSDPAFYMRVYSKGIDQYLYHHFNPNTFINNYCSYHTVKKELSEYDIYLFNQNHTCMYEMRWFQKYFLKR